MDLCIQGVLDLWSIVAGLKLSYPNLSLKFFKNKIKREKVINVENNVSKEGRGEMSTNNVSQVTL